MSELQEFLRDTCVIRKTEFGDFQEVRPRIVCKDGWTVSVQAGQYMYCSPRMDAMQHYESVEAGYPDAPVPKYWYKYAEDQPTSFWGEMRKNWHDALVQIRHADSFRSLFRSLWFRVWPKVAHGRLTQTVYGYIPADLVDRAIAEHGGIDHEYYERESNKARVELHKKLMGLVRKGDLR